jgi:phosphopentomutase
MLQLIKAGVPVTSVGKIKDIYAGVGVSNHVKAATNPDITRRTIELVQNGQQGLIFANLVDFDMLYGHRRDVKGFAGALQALDDALPELMASMQEGDLLMLTADHGNDPTMPGSDHCREYVPVLVFNPARQEGIPLGTRGAFADIGATIAEAFGVPGTGVGSSFLHEVI